MALRASPMVWRTSVTAGLAAGACGASPPISSQAPTTNAIVIMSIAGGAAGRSFQEYRRCIVCAGWGPAAIHLVTSLPESPLLFRRLDVLGARLKEREVLRVLILEDLALRAHVRAHQL